MAVAFGARRPDSVFKLLSGVKPLIALCIDTLFLFSAGVVRLGFIQTRKSMVHKWLGRAEDSAALNLDILVDSSGEFIRYQVGY